jgi:hypothetical protein
MDPVVERHRIGKGLHYVVQKAVPFCLAPLVEAHLQNANREECALHNIGKGIAEVDFFEQVVGPGLKFGCFRPQLLMGGCE